MSENQNAVTKSAPSAARIAAALKLADADVAYIGAIHLSSAAGRSKKAADDGSPEQFQWWKEEQRLDLLHSDLYTLMDKARDQYIALLAAEAEKGGAA